MHYLSAGRIARTCGLAVAAVAGAFLVRLLLDPVLGSSSPFHIFTLAVLTSSALGGRGSGLLASALAVLLANFFFLEPRGELTLSPFDLVESLVFAATCLGITWITDLLTRARCRAEEAVAESRRAEAALATAVERHRAVVETANDPIVVIDEAGVIQHFNRAAETLFGYPAAEAIGQDVAILLRDPNRYKPSTRGGCYRRTGERPIVGNEVEGLRRDGSVFPLDLSVAEWTAAGGRRFFTGIMRDLTAQKRQEAQLRQTQKLDAVGQLTSGIAHDFNNYLTVIVGNLERLAMACADRPKAVRLAEQAQTAASRAEHLVRQLLSFSRRQTLAPETLDGNAVVAGMADLLRSTLPGGIELALEPAPDLWRARADRNQLETALLNLVVNARDAIAEVRRAGADGGRITVRTANVTLSHTAAMGSAAATSTGEVAPGDYVELAVIDTGPGMPAAVLEHVFEPFFTTKERGKGTGLGLAQIYGFAQQSAGRIEIDSREGQGTTVRVLLPRDTVASADGSLARAPLANRGEAQASVSLTAIDRQWGDKQN